MHTKWWLVLLVALGAVWAAPLNLNPAHDALRPALALDRQNRPYTAWVEQEGLVYKAYVQRWNGQRWVRLGSALNLDPQKTVAYVALALSRVDQAVVAWTEKSLPKPGAPDVGKVYVAKWTGTRWQLIGASPNRSAYTVADIPILRLESRGYPVLAWSEFTYNVDNVYVARWDGQRWRVVDGGSLTIDVSTASRARDLALRRDDGPVLAWSWQIYRQDFNVYAGPSNGQGRWTKLGGSLNRDPNRYAGAPALALDAQDRPTVAFVEADRGFDVWVKRWNGQGWYTLGASPNSRSGGARSPRMALGLNDRPVVAYADNLGSDRLFVKAWDGAQWQPYGSALNQDPLASVVSYDLRLDSSGNPVVVWSEQVGALRQVFIKRWDGSSWQAY